jgi:aminopeptidase N
MTDYSYSVGAIFFALLYRLAGADAFNRILREYISAYGAHGGTTRELVDCIRKSSAADTSRLIRDWIYTTAWTGRLDRSADLKDLEAVYRTERGP